MQRMTRRMGVLLACFAALTGQAAQADAITVFAAASLRDALVEIAARHEADTGTSVTLVFAASSAMARQVARGAPADVVLLADRDWADWLVSQGAVGAVAEFAANRLVLAAPIGVTLDDIADLSEGLGDGILAMAQTDAVPAGRYGKAALVSLGLWDAVEPRVVQADNVRAALRFVERGEAAFGIGYASDLVALPALGRAYAFAQDSHPPIRYFGADLTAQGADFMVYMQDRTAQNILTDWGFAALAPE